MLMEGHERHMRLALELARATRGQTSPNPQVGAVIVKDGKIVGTGAHLGAGTPHAEVHALRMAGEAADGSTMYVTLEPCAHHGRTPPCTDAIIAAGIREVVLGCEDANPKVRGSGITKLRKAGIDVVTGVLESECGKLNEAFFHYIQSGIPFVTVKTASTLDGKIASASRDSKWVTGEQARACVQRLRHENDAIMVGIETVLADDPQLTARLPEGGLHPIRIIVDSRLRLPKGARVCDTTEAPTWVFCTEERDRDKEKALTAKGVRVFTAGKKAKVDLAAVFRFLGTREVTSVLVEGGSTLNGSLLREGLVHKVITFLAPKLLGGAASLTSFGGEGWNRMSDAISLSDVEVSQFGEDLCITGYPQFSPEGGE